ncbi:MAG: hypothetical protein AB1546_14135, partial [bacterium]
MKLRLKTIHWFLFILILAAIGTYFISQDISQFFPLQRDLLIFRNITIRAYKSGQLKWKLTAKKIRIKGKEGEIYTIEGIEKGFLHRKEKPPFTFTAQTAEYNSQLDEVLIKQPITFRSANGDFFEGREIYLFGKQKKVMITAPVRAKFDGNYFQADRMMAQGEGLDFITLRDNVRTVIPDIEKSSSEKVKKEVEDLKDKKKYMKNFTIGADVMTYNSVSRTLICAPKDVPPIYLPGQKPEKPEGFVDMNTERFDMRARQLQVNFEVKSVHAHGDVWIRRKREKPDPQKSRLARAIGKKDAVFQTDEMIYMWKEGVINIPNKVSMRQEKIDATSGSAVINLRADNIKFVGGTTLHQKSGEWLIRDEVIEKDAPKKNKEIAAAETTVRCDAVEVNLETEDILAAGGVSVVQKERKLNGESASYDGAEKAWRITGNPKAVEKENILTAETFIYDERSNRFIATGSARSEFLPDEDYKDDLDEYFSERDGEDEKREKFEKNKVAVEADELDYHQKDEILIAAGSVVVRYRDIVFAAPQAVINYKEKTVKGDGGVRIEDKYAETDAEKFHANWETRDLSLEGGVRMNHRGRKKT